MPLGYLESRQGNWFLHELPDGPRRECPVSALRQQGWGAISSAELGDDLDVEFEMNQGRVADVRRYAAVPEETRRILSQHGCDHSGLVLDKFIYRSPDQSFVRGALQHLVNLKPADGEFFAAIRTRREGVLDHLSASRFCRITAAPLTLHLARASALENAGICLHPIYGFTYLPGSGLKGMARAYAETIWKSGEPDQAVAQEKIEEVFGNQPGEPKAEKQKAGAIVFHDAWPTTWPKLIVDIVNNHHPKYYQREDAPGDWENPVPVYFLAVPPGQTFSFALAKRRSEESGKSEDCLKLAEDWLNGALTLLGCGAKTAAGYGAFKAETRPTVPHRPTFEATLELVTPAFLAGANQTEKDGCDLRPATLRGLLRWWWRTMHAGFVDVPTLRRMEAAVWGDIKAGGAIRIEVERAGSVQADRYPAKTKGRNKRNQEILVPDARFLGRHGITPSRGVTTQGLLYHSFGTDEMPAGKPDERKQRWFVPAGTKWKIRFTARDSRYVVRDENGEVVSETELCASSLLDQAKTALWWFCRLGGAGAKCRKGFGSFVDPAELAGFEGNRWKTKGLAFRETCKIPTEDFRDEWAESPCLKWMTELARSAFPNCNGFLEVVWPSDWANPWFALDQVGTFAQSFAQADRSTGHGKNCADKRGLGLPRRIGKNPEVELDCIRGSRVASPIWYHLGCDEQGNRVLRIAAFPTPCLRTANTSFKDGLERSRTLLTELLWHLGNCFQE